MEQATSFGEKNEETESDVIKRKMAARKYLLGGKDKEVQALASNLKEQRLLERTLQSLKLEEGYALKLVDLDHREIVTKEERLQRKVSGIKSHLDRDEIRVLRRLEAEGRLGSMCSTTNFSGYARIEAAKKRLKLGRHRLPRARSAHVRRLEEDPEVTSSAQRRPMTAFARTQGDQSAGTWKRRHSDCTELGSNSHGFEENGEDGDCNVNSVGVRPSTSQGFTSRKKSLHGPHFSTRPKTAAQDVTSARTTVTALHEESDHSLNANMASSPAERFSFLKDSTLASMAARKNADRHRRELMRREQMVNMTLEYWRENFIQRVDGWVRDSPAITANLGPPPEPKPEPNTSPFAKNRPQAVVKAAPRISTSSGRETDWKELRKCRYLRVLDAEIDLSGVNTLAMDQMRVFKSDSRVWE